MDREGDRSDSQAMLASGYTKSIVIYLPLSGKSMIIGCSVLKHLCETCFLKGVSVTDKPNVLNMLLYTNHSTKILQ